MVLSSMSTRVTLGTARAARMLAPDCKGERWLKIHEQYTERQTIHTHTQTHTLPIATPIRPGPSCSAHAIGACECAWGETRVQKASSNRDLTSILLRQHAHTHTHIYIYNYIYIYLLFGLDDVAQAFDTVALAKLTSDSVSMWKSPSDTGHTHTHT